MRSNPRVAPGLAAIFALTLTAASPAQSTDATCPMHQDHNPRATPAAPETTGPAETRAHHDHAMSPYAGKEGSEVKSLSAEELKAYREGTGMGMAKPAELNHYPGPRHVLDLASDLGLTAAQAADLKAVFDRMHGEAVVLGEKIIEKEKMLDREFSSGGIDERKLRNLTGQIAGLQADLRAAHLKAHLETRRILTQLQVARYDELRGYSKPAGS